MFVAVDKVGQLVSHPKAEFKKRLHINRQRPLMLWIQIDLGGFENAVGHVGRSSESEKAV